MLPDDDSLHLVAIDPVEEIHLLEGDPLEVRNVVVLGGDLGADPALSPHEARLAKALLGGNSGGLDVNAAA